MSTNASSQSMSRFAGVVAGGAVTMWFLFSILMSANGRFRTLPQAPPLALGLSLVLPIVIFVGLYLRHGAFWSFCQSIDLKLIVAANFWRVMALDFVLCGLERRLPLGFALPAGIGDMITGLTAIPLSFAILRQTPGMRKWFVRWNLFGLGDLVLAVTLGILHSPSAVGLFAHAGVTTGLMSELPRSLIPTFFVPLLILLHLLGLARRREILNGRTVAAAVER